MRIAMVSPLPPAATGIADYTVDVARALSRAHSVELFHDQAEVSDGLPTQAFRVGEIEQRARAAGPFEAVIYQMGNAAPHDFMYDWMERRPGAVVLHDLVLHHSYARRFLESPESRAYAADPSRRDLQLLAEAQHQGYVRAIEAANPGQGERLKDAYFNTTGDLLPYAFPLFEPALAGAVATGAHNAFMVEAVRRARPYLPCVPLAMPITSRPSNPAIAAALRLKLGLPESDPIVACFGLMTPEKRIESAARALARVAEVRPNVRFLLAGPVADRPRLDALLQETRVAQRAIVAGRLDANEFTAAMDLASVVIHLRYPTARETSAALLRVMAQGRPVIVSDIANQSEIPDDAVRRIDMCDEEGGVARALCWALDNPAEALSMGERARRYVSKDHSAEKTLETYERLLNVMSPHYSRAHS